MTTKDKTPNLGLPQYKETDLFDLTEINEAYKKIDDMYGVVLKIQKTSTLEDGE